MSMKMKSFSMEGMKKAPALIPLLAIVGTGVVGAVLYTIRLAVKNPDVSWDKKRNLEPWQKYENKQYKLWSSKDYSTLPPPERPKF
ncbi:NADH dehydrogenase 1 alpha subcomplex-like [Tropilaelaps mercedesae]|uniref:NADH dehydrogenase 1 alpha subcomplex-like n=1 Tax=Tropilaelaps mercedesae TaxID=418985 RepID=A0A1V9WZW7_9ACAR|nr:NADH dehydrogenase 1 alpha subcomplex-like [Tropilaelaps mercedesae]